MIMDHFKSETRTKKYLKKFTCSLNDEIKY